MINGEKREWQREDRGERLVVEVIRWEHRLERGALLEEGGRLTNSSYKIAGTFFDIKTDDGWIFTI